MPKYNADLAIRGIRGTIRGTSREKIGLGVPSTKTLV